ncbi:MAG: hypothetical protein HY516_02060 [Candidatus Aenigmarchaeota archaeon]|nr:hypothetical protein [Candidatus Aenigmarchaeota archaeon]
MNNRNILLTLLYLCSIKPFCSKEISDILFGHERNDRSIKKYLSNMKKNGLLKLVDYQNTKYPKSEFFVINLERFPNWENDRDKIFVPVGDPNKGITRLYIETEKIPFKELFDLLGISTAIGSGKLIATIKGRIPDGRVGYLNRAVQENGMEKPINNLKVVFYIPQGLEDSKEVIEILERLKTLKPPKSIGFEYSVKKMKKEDEEELKIKVLIPLAVNFGIKIKQTQNTKSLYPQLITYNGNDLWTFYPQHRKGEGEISIINFLNALESGKFLGLHITQYERRLG